MARANPGVLGIPVRDVADIEAAMPASAAQELRLTRVTALPEHFTSNDLRAFVGDCVNPF